MALSERGKVWAQPDDGMLLWTIVKDLWHPQSNPNGYASLGIAENTLMHDTLSKHIRTNLNPPNHAFTYGDGPGGTDRLRKAMARFLTKHLRPFHALQPSHITVTNGVTSTIEHFAFLLANPGEGFLLGQPHYGAFILDLTVRAEAFVQLVPFGDVDPLSLAALQAYEQAILNAQHRGKKIVAIMLCNPHNPLGRCYSRDTLIAFMRLCEKYQIHLISDEIYALSIWSNTIDTDPPPTEFTSCLSIDSFGIIDPSRLHVIWGTSKDFGANGIRLGAIISQHNETLHKALVPVSLLSSASSLADHAFANILEDDRWVEQYLRENRRKLSEHYRIAASWAKANKITYKPGVNAAFFLWVDLGSAYKDRNPGRVMEDSTAVVMEALLRKKVFLASGKQFGSGRAGWFRIVFSHQKELLEEGLKRIVLALDESDDSRSSKSRL